jgi:hypothetical protein
MSSLFLHTSWFCFAEQLEETATLGFSSFSNPRTTKFKIVETTWITYPRIYFAGGISIISVTDRYACRASYPFYTRDYR